MSNSNLRRVLNGVAVAGASLALGLTQVSAAQAVTPAEASAGANAAAGFCGVADFNRSHYTTTNPHVDHWEFVIHLTELEGGQKGPHVHIWYEPDHHGSYEVECPEEDWFTP